MQTRIMKMKQSHVEVVEEIEISCFLTPWSSKIISNDLSLDCAMNFVALSCDGSTEKIIGYLCAWVVSDECTINKIACHWEYRRTKTGTLLLNHLFEAARLKGSRNIYLEVRRSNIVAQMFYLKNGFLRSRISRAYCSDTNEDAIVMELAL